MVLYVLSFICNQGYGVTQTLGIRRLSVENQVTLAVETPVLMSTGSSG